jgi:hypothetical protein
MPLMEAHVPRPLQVATQVQDLSKTTFLRRLIKVDAEPVFREAVALYINLGTQAALTLDIRRFVVEDIIRQLREDHAVDIEEGNFVRGVYNLELERFATSSIYATLRDRDPSRYLDKELSFLESKLEDKEQHLKYSLNHISRGRKKQIVMFLDNADQRDEETQQSAFLIAQEIAENWPATIFVSLRPETFNRSATVGALTGYSPKVFTIAPPRIERVIDKRLGFALELAIGNTRIEALPEGVVVGLESFASVIKAFRDSLTHLTHGLEIVASLATLEKLPGQL